MEPGTQSSSRGRVSRYSHPQDGDRGMVVEEHEKVIFEQTPVGDTYQEVWDLFQEHIKAKGAEK